MQATLEQRLLDDLHDRLLERNRQRNAAVANAYSALKEFYSRNQKQIERATERMTVTDMLLSVLPEFNGHTIKPKKLKALILARHPLQKASYSTVRRCCLRLGEEGHLKRVRGGWLKNVALLLLSAVTVFAQPPPLPALAAQPPPVQNPFVQKFGIIGDATGVDSYVVFIATNSITDTNYQYRVAFTNAAWLDLIGTTNLVEIFKTNLVSGVTNYLRAMAVSTNGVASSELSDEINYVPKRAPTIQLWFQEGASVDGPWRTLTNGPVEVEATQPKQFFRVLARKEP